MVRVDGGADMPLSGPIPEGSAFLNFGIIVNLDNLISHLRTRHRRLRDRDRRPVAIACQPIAATYWGAVRTKNLVRMI